MIVYARYNNGRRAEFELATLIEETASGLAVIKRAVTTEASEFVASFRDKFQRLSERAIPLTPVEVEVRGNEAHFPYVEGDTLLIEWTRCLKSASRQDLLAAVDEFKRLLEAFPIVDWSPNRRFSEIWGDTGQPGEPALSCGLVDLNLDNIIRRADGKLFLIDYEWLFDFPMPRKFVLFRALVGWYGASTSHRPWDVCSLEELFQHVEISEEDVFRLTGMESAFQEHVTGQLSTFAADLANLLRNVPSTLHSPSAVFDLSVRAIREQITDLELDNVKKHEWIVKLEESCASKDQWIAQLEEICSNKEKWIEKLTLDIKTLNGDQEG